MSTGPSTNLPTGMAPRTLPLLLAATLGAWPLGSDAMPLHPVPLDAIVPQMETDGPLRLAPAGLQLDIDRRQTLTLPLRGLDLLELDVRSEGYFTLVWSDDGPPDTGRWPQPPHYQRLPPGISTVRIPMLVGGAALAGGRPVLMVDGTGRLTITAVRASPLAPAPSDAKRQSDLATLLFPETIWHTTVNRLTPPQLSADPPRWFADRAALLGAVAAVVAGGLAWRRGGAPRAAAKGLVAGCLVASALSDGLLLVRLLPAFRLAPPPRVEERIRDNYYFDAEFGALAALARSTLRPTERVGTIAAADDWFTRQTLCFNLAPRPCVKVEGAGPRFPDLAGVRRLSLDELDAVVVSGDAVAPAGFVPVARVSPYAFVARRP